MRQKISVLGSGGWGIALAIHAFKKGFQVVLWSPFEDEVNGLLKNRTNERLLKGIIIPEAIETYKNNIGKHIVYGDIRMISSKDIPDNPDVVIGGFPCQGFSIANTKRSMEDQRNFLYKEMLRVIRDKKPKMFVAENVKGLLSMEKGKVFEMIKKDFTFIKIREKLVIAIADML